MDFDRLAAAKFLACQVYTTGQKKDGSGTDPDKVWEKLSSDTQKWALDTVDRLHEFYHPSEPCYECGSTERMGTACKPCNPEITDPNFGYSDEKPPLAPPPPYMPRG